LLSFIVVGALTPWMRKFAIQINFIDQPNAAHKSHSEGVPYLGGIAIIFGILSVTFAAVFTQESMRSNLLTALSLLGPAFALGMVGLIDDYKSLNPLPRFVAQTIAGIITASIVVITNSIGNPTGNVLLDVGVTIFWIVGISNSINFFDNLDGGAAGSIFVTSFALSVLSESTDQYLIRAMSLTICGAMLGFLIWNKSPARIYMGDAGALFLGTIIATLTIRLDPNVNSATKSFSIPVLLLAVPILDTTVAVFSRIRRGKSIFKGGHDHLSHRLIRKGLSKKETAFVLWTLSSIFAVIAILVMKQESISNYWISFSTAFWLILFVLFLKVSDE
jgi:UDP-GlcNAc:undecaprenyl-phosphate/decaprenyl-phosphate GlcNAc-1-phosphate transferase